MTWTRLIIARIVFKATLVFVALNGLFALLQPVPLLGRASLYNVVYPGRERLPYGENPALSYNLSLFDLNAMFASHALARRKATDEFRVVMLGDSSVWGFLLRPEETVAGQLNARALRSRDGRRVRAYNLGYPIMALTKDVLILNEALQHQPDLVLWFVTLESFAAEAQTTHPLVRHNAERMSQLQQRVGLSFDQSALVRPSLLERTLIGQRRALADWVRLQLFGVLWAATGIDQHYPESYTPAQRDFTDDLSWHGHQPPQLLDEALAFDALEAGIRLAHTQGVTLLLINEPILISEGKNSHIRYNAFYPRWAYDLYRQRLRAWTEAHHVTLLDAWDVVPQSEFTDSAVHTTPYGVHLLVEQLIALLREQKVIAE